MPTRSLSVLPTPFLLAILAAQDARPLPEHAAEAIEAQCRRDRIPGLSCAIGIGDAVVFARGFGLACVENGVAATDATVYRLASISKPVTAVAAMQLAERGELDLDASVHEIVREWPQKQWPVTTRQLLSHLGGVRHYRGEAESTRHFANQRAALGRFADDPLLHEPGTTYHYSTYGYNLVAAVVETRTGKTFAEVVRERIAGPSGAATLQDDDLRRIIPGRAQGYVLAGGELRNSALMDGSYKLGGGGLCSSAPDLVRFAQALVAGRLVQKTTLEQMWTPQQPANGKRSEYGLGFRIGALDGHRTVAHSGAQSRVSTMLLIVPERGIAVALLCNLEGVRLAGLAADLAKFALAAAAHAR
jgi:CubicO group peptidase (beta-lactamase class C family)